jgi:hypothetical protein
MPFKPGLSPAAQAPLTAALQAVEQLLQTDMQHRPSHGHRRRRQIGPHPRLGLQGGGLVFSDRPTALRPPVDADWPPGSTVELHRQAPAFVRSLGERLQRGAAFFIDYGFPDEEYYHPQRSMGTLLCHRAHQVDADPLADPGEKDITAHVDFTGIALAAQEAGLAVLGYTSQASFLFNCGLAELMQAADLPARSAAHRLMAEHEMGELFKVLAFTRGLPTAWQALGFLHGDRSHRLRALARQAKLRA